MIKKAGKGRPSLFDTRKNEIIRIAARLFVKSGFLKTTMREIARACGINAGTLYYYFKSKDDILYLIINNAAQRPDGWRQYYMNRCQNLGAARTLQEFIEAYYRSIDEAQDICLFTYQETRNLDRASRRIVLNAANRDVDVCAGILKAGIASGELCMDNATLVAHDIITLGHMWAVRRWYLQRKFTLDEYIKHQTELIFSRIKPEPTGN